MFCLYCGTNLPDDAVFCNKCGKQQKAVPNTPVPDVTILPGPAFLAAPIDAGQPPIVFDSRKTALPHIWGTDELMQKLLDGVFASEAISS